MNTKTLDFSEAVKASKAAREMHRAEMSAINNPADLMHVVLAAEAAKAAARQAAIEAVKPLSSPAPDLAVITLKDGTRFSVLCDSWNTQRMKQQNAAWQKSIDDQNAVEQFKAAQKAKADELAAKLDAPVVKIGSQKNAA